MTAPLDIGVVGCGFAGSAAALFLARAGHRLTIYERVAEPAAIGAGILLQPTGLAVLARLGLLESVAARGAPVHALDCRTSAGRPLFHLRYERLAAGLHGLGLHRGALYEALLGAIRAGGVSLRCGIEVDAIQDTGARPRLCTAGGAVLGEHDLVVVADGARSRFRDRSPARVRARPYRFGALWFVGRDDERRFAGTLSQVCAGTRRMVGFLPTGLGPEGGTAPLVSLFWSLRMDTLDDWRRGGLDVWKREVLALEPRADELLAQIHDADQLLAAGYVDGVMRRVFEGRVVYVGDAAHATSPQLGQGTNLALCDAAALADALAPGDALHLALRRYARARRAHTRFYQVTSRWLTPFFQSDSRWLGPLRDRLFPLALRLPFFHDEMVRTLSGIKRGLFHRSLPLPPPDTARALPARAMLG
ncbi:MAG TPA: NAD(P)/FAD-dependent oxidoreductase [Polyangia bacterium]|nr:NAD(P)/FAD-dependent oxidoreductase [Polyangia bacterium]